MPRRELWRWATLYLAEQGASSARGLRAGKDARQGRLRWLKVSTSHLLGTLPTNFLQRGADPRQEHGLEGANAEVDGHRRGSVATTTPAKCSAASLAMQALKGRMKARSSGCATAVNVAGT